MSDVTQSDLDGTLDDAVDLSGTHLKGTVLMIRLAEDLTEAAAGPWFNVKCLIVEGVRYSVVGQEAPRFFECLGPIPLKQPTVWIAVEGSYPRGHFKPGDRVCIGKELHS